MEDLKKIFVITKEDGTIVGTHRTDDSALKEKSSDDTSLKEKSFQKRQSIFIPVAGPGQVIHEIKVPSRIYEIKNIKEYHDALNLHMKHLKPIAPAGDSNNIVALLERFAELKERRILTEEEFQAQKKKILGT